VADALMLHVRKEMLHLQRLGVAKALM